MGKIDDKKKDIQALEERIDQFFDPLTGGPLNPPRGLEGRVMERLKTQQGRIPRWRSTKTIAVWATALTGVVVAFSFWSGRGAFEAVVGEELAVRVDVRGPAQTNPKCLVQIQLPAGVHFFS